MTTLERAVPPGLLGEQRPRVSSIPSYSSTSGEEAVDLAAMAGLDLDPWQAYVLTEALGERPDGKWSAFEVGVVVSRQNGKGGLLEARELAGLFLLGERLIVHSAHQFDTSLEAFRRLLALIEDTPTLSKRVQRVSKSHGEEGIELKSRQRIRFRTRTAGGGRGFTGDCLILDEAMILKREMMGALLPTLSARPNPQVWYTGSAVDEDVHEHGLVLAKIRERGIEGSDPGLAYFEWSVDPERYATDPNTPVDPAAWAEANPGLGIRISSEYVANEQRALHPRTFATERLAVGHWPSTDDDDGRVISSEAWAACADARSEIETVPVFAVDVTPDRSRSSIAVAGARNDGLGHVEVVENRKGTAWVAGRCVELLGAHEGCRFVMDPRSPAGSLIKDLVEAKVPVEEISTQDYGRACGSFFDAVSEAKVRFPAPQPELDMALTAATVRPLGEAWAWARKSLVDISPLVAATLALWGARETTVRAPRVWDLAALLAEETDEED